MPPKSNKPRADGRIAVQVYLGLENGKRKYKTVYGSTQKEADSKATDVKLKHNKGIDIAADRDTFSQWRARWLKLKKFDKLSKGRMTAYESALKHLRDIDGMPILKITTDDIQEIIFDLSEYNPNTGKATSKNTLKEVRNAAIQVFSLAIERRVLDYNPAKAVKIPDNAIVSKKRALTDEEQQWILNTPHRATTAAMIMMYAGLRRGELIPLTWSDIDLENGIIDVNKSVYSDSNKFVVKLGAKTDAGTRKVYIPQVLISYLSDCKDKGRGEVVNLHPLVCSSAKGNMYTSSGWRSLWSSYIDDLNLKYGDFSDLEKIPKKFMPEKIPLRIPKLTPHWLRHTFATLLYMSGVDVLTAKEQLGHADIETTLNIYTHLDARFKQRSMVKLNDYLKNASHMQVSEIR